MSGKSLAEVFGVQMWQPCFQAWLLADSKAHAYNYPGDIRFYWIFQGGHDQNTVKISSSSPLWRSNEQHVQIIYVHI